VSEVPPGLPGRPAHVLVGSVIGEFDDPEVVGTAPVGRAAPRGDIAAATQVRSPGASGPHADAASAREDVSHARTTIDVTVGGEVAHSDDIEYQVDPGQRGSHATALRSSFLELQRS
jgi:hypothetical protein